MRTMLIQEEGANGYQENFNCTHVFTFPKMFQLDSQNACENGATLIIVLVVVVVGDITIYIPFQKCLPHEGTKISLKGGKLRTKKYWARSQEVYTKEKCLLKQLRSGNIFV